MGESEGGMGDCDWEAGQAGWADLTWEDLLSWAGTKYFIRGKEYQQSGYVYRLARLGEDRLLAWVQRVDRYATVVRLLPPDGNFRLHSRCSCPCRVSGCKHAVAVVLTYLVALGRNEPVPHALETDARLTVPDESGVPVGCREPGDGLSG
jgi:uncharacterized Zn finger protein